MKAMKAASVAASTRQRWAASKSPKAKTKTVSSNALKLKQLFVRKIKALVIMRMRGAYTDVAPNGPGPGNAELQRALANLEVGHAACEAMVKLSRSTLRRLRQVVSMTREGLRRMEILAEEDRKNNRRLQAWLSPSSCGPAGASPHTTGTSRTPLGVGSLDRRKDTPHRALHPHRCKARVGRDAGGVWR